MRHRVVLALVGSLLTLFLASTTLLAQTGGTAQINGTVKDPSGLALPGVTVTATQTDTGFTRTVTTDGDGGYVMPNLPTGPYRLEASLQGFATPPNSFYRSMVPAIPQRFVRLHEGQSLRIGAHEWRVIIGRGHAPEHACLWCQIGRAHV